MTTFIDNHSIAIIAPLAFLQLSIIPGLILVSYFRCKTNVFTLSSLIFAISLVFNYCLVLLLASFQIFTQPILFTIVLSEIIYLLLI